ncbi:hypothetical protein [Jannaschia rubra]|uniref:Uncharacterized protein n=1 Tax=Jannaschia rubra TaxID=282197 RepID=A0A0M6XTB6_9RHOB|nr:hypothetical protein [Jannaschia rubra]CTQ34350.1 hypothetical protein JAN5088_03145 [Jannaschia rubra]SFG63078.1 hypothetical protein SAMN04488517_10886 [Jannaschia rubra]
MMLGDVLAAAQRSGADIETWLKPADPDLWQTLNAQAAAGREDAVTFARAAIADFSNRAGEEDWAMLVSRMRDADDPGRALLITMIRWRLGIIRKETSGANEEMTP